MKTCKETIAVIKPTGDEGRYKFLSLDMSPLSLALF